MKMPSHLQNLQNNEAILLMYLADELTGEDRAEVEQMLATDAILRNELDYLRDSQEKVLAELAVLDRQPTRISQAVAVRQVSRAMKQWQVDRLSRPREVPVTRRGLRYAWWIYPSVSAASIVIASIIWWGMNNPDNSPSGPTAEATDPVKSLMASFQDSEQTNDHLADAEQQAMNLNNPSDDNFMPEAGQ
jgi:hypothetical protein